MKWAPAITWMVKLLKVAVPVGGAILKGAADEIGLANIKDNIDVIDKMAGVLPSGKLEAGASDRPELGLIRSPEGAELRLVHDFLRKVLPDRRWGNLRRTDGRDFLWLCPTHYREYEGEPASGFDTEPTPDS